MLNSKQQIINAKKFIKLHENELFLLPNAWNGGSAKVFAKKGFEAIGTTSAGIAYSLGYSDGENIEFSDILRVTKEIVKVVEDIPLSVDLERGYSKNDDISEVLANVKNIINSGAVGINIEDGITEDKSVDSLEYFCEKISAINDLKKELNIPFFINARTDIYLLQTADNDQKIFEMTVQRAAALKLAGADCIFIPGALDKETIIKLRNNIELPINLFVHPKFNNIKDLTNIGINRLSSGSAPVRTVFNELIKVSEGFKNNDCNKMLNHGFNYAIANEFFKNT